MVPIGPFPFPCSFSVQTYKYNDRTKLLTNGFVDPIRFGLCRGVGNARDFACDTYCKKCHPTDPNCGSRTDCVNCTKILNANMANPLVFLAKLVHVSVHALPLVDCILYTNKVCHLTHVA